MTCREVIELLDDFAEGDASGRRPVEFEQHLAECPDCAAYVKSYLLTVNLIRDAYEPFSVAVK